LCIARHSDATRKKRRSIEIYTSQNTCQAVTPLSLTFDLVKHYLILPVNHHEQTFSYHRGFPLTSPPQSWPGAHPSGSVGNSKLPVRSPRIISCTARHAAIRTMPERSMRVTFRLPIEILELNTVLLQGTVDNSEGGVPSGRASHAAAAPRHVRTAQTGQQRQA
jgi:hypothetical protein